MRVHLQCVYCNASADSDVVTLVIRHGHLLWFQQVAWEYGGFLLAVANSPFWYRMQVVGFMSHFGVCKLHTRSVD